MEHSSSYNKQTKKELGLKNVNKLKNWGNRS